MTCLVEFRASDDVFLDRFPEVAEICRITGYFNDEVLVLLRVCLSVPERLRGHDIRLQVHAAHFEVGLDKVGKDL